MKKDILEEIYDHLVTVTTKKYSDIIQGIVKIKTPSGVITKIRVIFVDNSFLDVYWSPSGRYSLHYEKKRINGTMYRHDNAPHKKHRTIITFPKHFHKGSENNVEESYLPTNPIKALEYFLEFIVNLVRKP